MQSSAEHTVKQLNEQQAECRAFVEPHLDLAFRVLALKQPPASALLSVVHEAIYVGPSSLDAACKESTASLGSEDQRAALDTFFQSVQPLLHSLMSQTCASRPQSAEQARQTLLNITAA
jgi:hypothetical protein